MRTLILFIISLCPLVVLYAQTQSQQRDDDLGQYLSLQHRVQVACQQNAKSDLCQAWLQGMYQGVRATGEQAEKMAVRWAQLYEMDGRNHPEAWLTRDVLNAVSCSPDALAFVSSYVPAQSLEVPQSASGHVAQSCGPIWTAGSLAPMGNRMVSNGMVNNARAYAE